MAARKNPSLAPLNIEELLRPKRKFRNTPTVVDGRRFDSKKEAERYSHLKIAQEAGVISDLQCQVRYDLHAISGHKLWTYVADFVYVRGGELIVEDVKSPITRKQPVYVAKKRHMKLELGIEISEW